MVTRKQQREDARRNRALLEQKAIRRKKKARIATFAGLAVAAIVVFAVAMTAGGGPGPGNAVDVNSLPGLQDTPAPWQPEYGSLVARLSELGFPPNGDESYHVHALLHVYVDGQPVTVPANIGISMQDRVESPMHTHDTSGVIHMEADDPYPFTLGDFFDVWGVRLTDSQLGSYQDAGDKTVQAFVNGQPVSDPAGYVIKPCDNIVIAYGRPGSFPSRPSADALSGLC